MLGTELDRQILETYSGLESGDLLVRQSVGLGNDGNQVDLGMKTLHHLNVERLQRVAGGLDEEDAGMDAVIYDVHAVDLILRIEISIVTLFDVIDNGSP